MYEELTMKRKHCSLIGLFALHRTHGSPKACPRIISQPNLNGPNTAPNPYYQLQYDNNARVHSRSASLSVIGQAGVGVGLLLLHGL
jgi:hypothetical protein